MRAPEHYLKCDSLELLPEAMQRNYRAELDLLERLLPAGSRVLQVGSLDGRRIIRLQERRPDLRLTGLDIEPEFVELARRNADEAGVEAKFVLGDITDPPSLGHFDWVICLNNTLGYIGDRKKALAEMQRLGDNVALAVYGESFDKGLAKAYFDAIGLDDYAGVKRFKRRELEDWGGQMVATPAGYLVALESEVPLDEKAAEHVQKLAELSTQVRRFYRRSSAFKVYHGNTNSTRVLEFDRSKMVDVSRFTQVLSVDSERKAAVVEGNVAMDVLVDAVLPLGLVPPIVPEFPGITVAGALQGGAGESSSFKWGGFSQTLNWFEMVLADGSVVRASPEEKADLFYGAAGAYGSLGVVTAAEVQLVDASPLVELELQMVPGFEPAAHAIKAAVADGPDFVDGVMFAPDSGVVIVGRMVDRSEAPVWRVSRRRDEWYFLRLEQEAKTGKPLKVAMPIRDYLFRYDRGAFWMGRYAFRRFKKPFNRVTRWLLDPMMHTRRMYEALQASGVSQEFVIQDLAMPWPKAVEFMDWVDSEFSMYPLWLCPLKIDDPGERSPLLSRPLKNGMALNVGVWGYVDSDLDAVVAANRRLEAKVTALGGRKWLYAYAYYTEDEFWELYDREWYDALRRKYHAETLPTVFDKVCRAGRVEVRAKRGVLIALLGRKGIRIRD